MPTVGAGAGGGGGGWWSRLRTIIGRHVNRAWGVSFGTPRTIVACYARASLIAVRTLCRGSESPSVLGTLAAKVRQCVASCAGGGGGKAADAGSM